MCSEPHQCFVNANVHCWVCHTFTHHTCQTIFHTVGDIHTICRACHGNVSSSHHLNACMPSFTHTTRTLSSRHIALIYTGTLTYTGAGVLPAHGHLSAHARHAERWRAARTASCGREMRTPSTRRCSRALPPPRPCVEEAPSVAPTISKSSR